GVSGGQVRSSRAFGPSTLTCPGARVTFTDFGTGTGSFPIRDNFCSYLLPDIREHFAAQTLAQRLPSAHDSLSGAEDGDAESAEDSRDLGLASVDPQPWAADPLHAGDHSGPVRPGLAGATHRLPRA